MKQGIVGRWNIATAKILLVSTKYIIDEIRFEIFFLVKVFRPLGLHRYAKEFFLLLRAFHPSIAILAMPI